MKFNTVIISLRFNKYLQSNFAFLTFFKMICLHATFCVLTWGSRKKSSSASGQTDRKLTFFAAFLRKIDNIQPLNQDDNIPKLLHEISRYFCEKKSMLVIK